MVAEARLEGTEHGLVPDPDGWFVLNARDARWYHGEGSGAVCVEGEERLLRQWDLVHCPAGTRHVVVGAGEAGCLVLAVGARDRSRGPDWGGHPVDAAAQRHGAGVARETTVGAPAYAGFTPRDETRYREGWLPD